MADKNKTDKRIVQMEFDNEQFKKETNETIRALDRLTESLQFNDASKGFSNVENAINRINLSGIERDVGTLTSRFSLFGNIAFNSLNRISNKILDTAHSAANFISSLGQMANMADGFGKYEETVEATQTIMAATASEFENTGEQMEFVSTQLDRLRWFTDETSYSFTDMASNIGKFTSAGVDLKTAVASMRGIAAWAALSGANAQKASIAMYNFSQSLGKGYMQLTDWRSLENINMATLEFKNQLIDLAIEMGKVEKVGENMYHAVGANAAHVFSAEGMSEYLSDRWFDTELIQRVLSVYGDFSGKLNALGDATGFTATEMLDMMDEFREGTIDLEKYSKIGGVGVDFLTDALKDLTSADMAIGEKGLRAAQETKTLSDAINYVKDAVSSGWSKTFELIIGNEQQAIDFWSQFAEEMYDIFVKVGDDRNELLAEWNEMGGRNLFIESIFNGLTAIKNLIEPIKEGFHDIFPPATAETLYNLTERLNNFTQGLILNESAQEKVRAISRKVFSIFASGITHAKNLFAALSPLGYVIKDIATTLAKGLLSFSGNNKGILDLNDILTVFTNVVYSLSKAIATLYTKIKGSQGIAKAIGAITGGIGNIGTGALKKINSFATYIMDFSSSVGSFVESIGANGLSATVKSFVDYMLSASNSLNDIYNAVKNFYSKFKEFYDQYLSDMTLKDILNLGIMTYFTVALVKHLKTLNKTTSTIGDLFNSLISQIENIGEAKSKLTKAKAFKELATALGIIALSIIGLVRTVNMENIGGALGGLTAAVAALYILSKSMENVDLSPVRVFALIEFSAAVGMLAKSIMDLSTVFNGGKGSWTKFAQTILAFGTIVGLLGGFATVFLKLSKTTSIIEEGKKVLEKLNLFGLAASLLSMAVSVNLLVTALKTIGDPNNLSIIQNGMSTFVKIMVTVAGAMTIMEIPQIFNNVGFKNVASSIISIAVLLLAAGKAIEQIGSLDTGTIVKGTATIGFLIATIGGLVTIVSTIGSLGGSLSGAAATILSLAVSLNLLVAPIKALYELKISELVKGVLAVAAALALLSVGLLAINTININAQGTLKSAAAILVMASSLEVIALAIKTIAALPVLAIVKSLVTLGVALAGLTVVATILEPLSGGLIALGGGLLMIAGAATLFSASMAIIIGAIVLLGNIAPNALENAVTAILKIGPAIGEAAGLALNSLLETFDKYSYLIAYHFVSGLVKGILGLLAGAVSGLISGFASAFQMVMDAFDKVDMKAYAAEKGADTVEGFNEGAKSKSEELERTMSAVGETAAKSAVDGGLNPQTGAQIGSDFLSAVKGSVLSDGSETIDVFGALGLDSESALSQYLNGGTGSGIASDFMSGINDAIGESASTVLSNLNAFGTNAVNVTAAALNSVQKMMSGLNAALSGAGQIKEGAKSLAFTKDKLNKSLMFGTAGLKASQQAPDYEKLKDSAVEYATTINTLQSNISSIETQLTNASSGMDSWNSYVKDYVSGMDWKGIGSGAGTELGEGLNEAATGGGGGGGRKGSGGASGTAKDMAKVIEGECKVVMNETGHYIAENITAGLKEDASIEEVAKGKANNIKNAFQEVFDQVDLDQKLADSEYNLWVAANEGSDDIQKRIMEVKHIGDQMETLAKKSNIAKDELAQLTEEFGANSEEVTNAQINVNELMTELENLNNKYKELRELSPDLYLPEIDMDKNGKLSFIETGEIFSEELVKALDSINGDYKKSGEELVESLIGGVDGGLDDNEAYLITSIRTLMETAEVPILDSYDNYVDAGQNLLYGFAEGLTSKDGLARVEEASSYVAGLASDTLNAALQINSPSKLSGLSGRFFDEGFANNIVKYAFMSEDAAQSMGENTIQILTDSLKSVLNLVTADYEYSPVIKPVVDTSNVATAADYITSTFATPSSIRLGSRPDTPFNRNLRAIRMSMQEQEDYDFNKENETVNAINGLAARLDRQEAAIRSMQIVMDSGELVGSIAGGMDQGLGTRSKYKRRGN